MKKLISYVLPVYNESGSIEEFYRQLTDAAKKIDKKYKVEFVFVNDGSRDESLEKLKLFSSSDPRIKIVNFSRNFGHQAAVTAGIDIARGDAIIIIDTDLQDPPEVSLDLIKKWEQGFEVVYAQRKKRIDNRFKLFAIFIHYRLLRSLSDLEIPVDTGDFRLIDKKVAVELRKLRESNRYVRGLVSFVGFKQGAVKYDRDKRFAGESNYPFAKLLSLSLNGITGFSTKPLELIGKLGFGMFFFTLFGMFCVLAVRIFSPETSVPGWAFTAVALFFISSIQFIILGVMGVYIGRIYNEVQDRPIYIVSDITQKDPKSS